MALGTIDHSDCDYGWRIKRFQVSKTRYRLFVLVAQWSVNVYLNTSHQAAHSLRQSSVKRRKPIRISFDIVRYQIQGSWHVLMREIVEREFPSQTLILWNVHERLKPRKNTQVGDR